MAIGAPDPAWQPYDAPTQHPGKGKGHGHPHSPVPEPAATGAAVLGLSVLLVAVLRWRARRLSEASVQSAC